LLRRLLLELFRAIAGWTVALDHVLRYGSRFLQPLPRGDGRNKEKMATRRRRPPTDATALPPRHRAVRRGHLCASRGSFRSSGSELRPAGSMLSEISSKRCQPTAAWPSSSSSISIPHTTA